MKNKSTGEQYVFSFISFAVFLLSVVIFNPGCKKIMLESLPVQVDNSANTIAKRLAPFKVDSTAQLVIWIKPGTTPAVYQFWLDTLRQKHGQITETKICASCDKSLRLLTGPGISTYTGGKTASGGTSGATVDAQGEDGPVYRSRNFVFAADAKYPKQAPQSPIDPVIVKHAGGVVKVAVFDTGLDDYGINQYSFLSTVTPCIPGAGKGWNFVNNNNDFRDNSNVMHGSTVTRFITNQVESYARNNVQILPVKTHDSEGKSDLFTILCAFSYAKQMGVQIINASFGFYQPLKTHTDDPNILLMKKYVKEYLTKNKILLIAAAGNKDDENEQKAFELYPGLTYPSEPRNLDQVAFYPASLARDTAFPNVFAITTVDVVTGTVSPIQNYSPNVVDMGVHADKVIAIPEYPHLNYIFKNPRLPAPATVSGSSFATPIATGKICANYDVIKSILAKTVFTKLEILNALTASSLIKQQSNLKAYTRNKNYMLK